MQIRACGMNSFGYHGLNLLVFTPKSGMNGWISVFALTHSIVIDIGTFANIGTKYAFPHSMVSKEIYTRYRIISTRKPIPKRNCLRLSISVTISAVESCKVVCSRCLADLYLFPKWGCGYSIWWCNDISEGLKLVNVEFTISWCCNIISGGDTIWCLLMLKYKIWWLCLDVQIIVICLVPMQNWWK